MKKKTREGIVRFEEISGAITENVLEFIYTGSVDITKENSKKKIAARNPGDDKRAILAPVFPCVSFTVSFDKLSERGTTLRVKSRIDIAYV